MKIYLKECPVINGCFIKLAKIRSVSIDISLGLIGKCD